MSSFAAAGAASPSHSDSDHSTLGRADHADDAFVGGAEVDEAERKGRPTLEHVDWKRLEQVIVCDCCKKTSQEQLRNRFSQDNNVRLGGAAFPHHI